MYASLAFGAAVVDGFQLYALVTATRTHHPRLVSTFVDSLLRSLLPWRLPRVQAIASNMQSSHRHSSLRWWVLQY